MMALQQDLLYTLGGCCLLDKFEFMAPWKHHLKIVRLLQKGLCEGLLCSSPLEEGEQKIQSIGCVEQFFGSTYLRDQVLISQLTLRGHKLDKEVVNIEPTSTWTQVTSKVTKPQKKSVSPCLVWSLELFTFKLFTFIQKYNCLLATLGLQTSTKAQSACDLSNQGYNRVLARSFSFASLSAIGLAKNSKQLICHLLIGLLDPTMWTQSSDPILLNH